MANLIRSAKSGNNWTHTDLSAYNITVVSQTKREFFSVDDLPAPTDPTLVAFMTTEDRADAPDDETKKLLHLLDLALDPKAGFQAAVTNFTAKLLEKLGYDIGHSVIFSRLVLPFLTCGVTSSAETDICVMDDDSEILLLVKMDNNQSSFNDPEAQVIAATIAAYAMYDRFQQEFLGICPENSSTFPAITIVGTNPHFYEITVTSELSAAVQQGIYPATETQVRRFDPFLPKRYSLGMRPLENRVVLLACLEGFLNTFVKTYMCRRSFLKGVRYSYADHRIVVAALSKSLRFRQPLRL